MLVKNIAGNYEAGWNMVDRESLTLSRNLTFLFEYTYDGIKDVSIKGDWKIERDTVFLSYSLTPQNESGPKVLERTSVGDSTIIRVVSRGDTLSNATIIVKSNGIIISGVTNLYGEFAILKIPLDTLTVFLNGYSKTEYKVKDLNSNLFIIDLGLYRSYFQKYYMNHVNKYVDTLIIYKGNLCGGNHFSFYGGSNNRFSCFFRQTKFSGKHINSAD